MGLPPALAPRQFGSLLRQTRIDAGLTQEALAERASLGVRSIQGLEQGESQPRPETLRRLADALGLSGERREHFEAAVRPTPRHASLGDLRRLSASPPGEVSTPRTNLPVQMTSFVGRERELLSVEGLLQSTRLLTLVGSGGCGKTRLAYEVAARQMGSYRDGVWVVELASLSGSDLVVSAVASPLGLRESPGRSLLAVLIEHLKPRHLLLVLDNCEHLVEACARVADALLTSCPELTVLATSREPLRSSGEVIYQVPSLSTPPLDRSLPVEDLAAYESVRLLVERAKAVQPGFDLSTANALAISEVCWRLDGMPLALELAAARMRGLSAEQLAQRLDDRFRLLTGGSRAALPRQQTLKATIDWSYDLLSPAEAGLLRRLAVFSGGWTLEAAEEVCGGECEGLAPISERTETERAEREDVLELLLRLVDRSLVMAEESPGGERYRLLDTIRQYAWEKLLDSGEDVLVRDRHRDWCLELVRQAEREVLGPDSVRWLDHLETEHDNLRAALSRCLESDVGAGLEIVGGLLWFWDSHCHYQEGSRWATELLARSSAENLPRARALRTAGMMSRGAGNWAKSAQLLEESVGLCRQLGDKRELGIALCLSASTVGGSGEYDRAEQVLCEAIEVSREVGNGFAVSDALWQLATLAKWRGDCDQSRSFLEESLAIAREIGHLHGIAVRLMALGSLELPGRDLSRARVLLEESLVLFRNEKHGFGISEDILRLGFLAMFEGDLARARTLLAESVKGFREIGVRASADWLELSAEIEAQSGSHQRAIRLLGAIDGNSLCGGAAFRPTYQGAYDAALALARAALAEETFSRVFAEGQAMTLEQAVEYALRDDRDG